MLEWWKQWKWLEWKSLSISKQQQEHKIKEGRKLCGTLNNYVAKCLLSAGAKWMANKRKSMASKSTCCMDWMEIEIVGTVNSIQCHE